MQRHAGKIFPLFFQLFILGGVWFEEEKEMRREESGRKEGRLKLFSNV